MPVRKALLPGKRRESPVPKLLCRKGFRQFTRGVGKLPQAGEQARFRAAAQGCDAYLTADIKYHEAQKAVEMGIAVADEAAVVAALADLQMKIVPEEGGQRIFLNGRDVTAEIRTAEIGKGASTVAAPLPNNALAASCALVASASPCTIFVSSKARTSFA